MNRDQVLHRSERRDCPLCAPDELCALCDSGPAKVLDLVAQVELLSPGDDDRRREAPGGDALLDRLMGHAPLTGKVGRRYEPAGAVDRAEGGLHGGGFGVLCHLPEHNISGWVLTTPSQVASIQPMKTTETTARYIRICLDRAERITSGTASKSFIRTGLSLSDVRSMTGISAQTWKEAVDQLRELSDAGDA